MNIMRAINFRGQTLNSVKDDKGNVVTEWKSWVYGDLLHRPNGVLHILTLDEEKGVYENHIITTDTFGQFTGVTDKNGKEIYEGDIVRWIDSDGHERIDSVKRINGGLCLCNSQYSVGSYYGLEVVGNIHDNPELIN